MKFNDLPEYLRDTIMDCVNEMADCAREGVGFDSRSVDYIAQSIQRYADEQKNKSPWRPISEAPKDIPILIMDNIGEVIITTINNLPLGGAKRKLCWMPIPPRPSIVEELRMKGVPEPTPEEVFLSREDRQIKRMMEGK